MFLPAFDTASPLLASSAPGWAKCVDVVPVSGIDGDPSGLPPVSEHVWEPSVEELAEARELWVGEDRRWRTETELADLAGLGSLDEVAPGPGLGRLLAGTGLADCDGSGLVEFVAAVRRQVAHLEAWGLAAVNELAHCPNGVVGTVPERVPWRHEKAAGAIEVHAGLSRYRAGRFDELAYELRERFIDTWQALCEGLIELDGAAAICDETPVLKDEDQQHQVESRVLGWVRDQVAKGRRIPSHEIRRRVLKEILMIDPEAAARRHKERVKDRGVELRPGLDSVADILLHDLPADQATEVFNHIDAIARLQKAGGDERTLNQLRADIAASLLAGRATLTSCDGTEESGTDEADDDTGDDADSDDAHTGDAGISDDDDADSDGSEDGGGDGFGVPDADRRPGCGHTGCRCTCASCTGYLEGCGITRCDCGCGCTPTDGSRESDPGPSPSDDDASQAGTEPAAVAGSAEQATSTSSESATSPLHSRDNLVLGHPPRVLAKNVIHVPLDRLLELYGLTQAGPGTPPAELGGFGPVIVEVAERILANHLDNPDADYAILVTHPRTGRPLQLHPVDARLFSGRLRDTIDIRWQHCTWPTMCSRPAPMCVGDHSKDHAAGGKTSEPNGNPLCNGHNREKTLNGWTQERPAPDTIDWTSPFGHTYRVQADTYNHDPPPF